MLEAVKKKEEEEEVEEVEEKCLHVCLVISGLSLCWELATQSLHNLILSSEKHQYTIEPMHHWTNVLFSPINVSCW